MNLTDTVTIPATYESNSHNDGTGQTITVADFLRRVYEWTYLAAHPK